MISREQIAAVQELQAQSQQAFAVTTNAQCIAVLALTTDFPDKEELQRVCAQHLISSLGGQRLTGNGVTSA